MGEGRESGESESRISTLRAAGLEVAPHADGVALYFPPLRAAAAAAMLALFGLACSLIGLASMGGLASSGSEESASLLALAFAGVFALPLFALGQLFIAIALWAAFNSLLVDVSAQGIRTERRFLGYPLARRAMESEKISAVESRFAAKYLGIFGQGRPYRLLATSSGQPAPLLIGDALHGPAVTETLRQLVIEQLNRPALLAAGTQVHLHAEEDKDDES